MPSYAGRSRPTARRLCPGDTHADLHVAAALDPIGGLLGVAQFPATPAGYARLLGWLAGFGTVCLVAIEGTGSYGAGLARHVTAAGVRVVEVDRSDRQYLVEYSRVLASGQRPFDEAAVHELVRRDVARARDFTATRNHDILPEGVQSRRSLASISAPTLVIHGSADPMFPLEHGRALADEIPRRTAAQLQGAGHGVERADWPTIVAAIAEHTTAHDRANQW